MEDYKKQLVEEKKRNLIASLEAEKGDYFIYVYPESANKEIPYKLYCPERFVNEAIRIYKEHRNLINDIVETYKIKGIEDDTKNN